MKKQPDPKKLSEDFVTRMFDFYGQVQGVGFRPYLYNLAMKIQLYGEIYNHPLGATAELTGNLEQLKVFEQKINHETKSPIIIKKMTSKNLPGVYFNSLKILTLPEQMAKLDIRGMANLHPLLSISPDRATCADCWKEFYDPNHRMYQYPFISCTHCGPRWTVIKELPFERDHTSYIDFPLCPECHSEWINPLSRRFNAQTMSCKTCGPQLELLVLSKNSKNSSQDIVKNIDSESLWNDINEKLLMGHIGAIKGLGGFQLVGDALNPQCIARMRQLKKRPDQAIAIMVKDFKTFVALKKSAGINKSFHLENAHILSDLAFEERLKDKFPDLFALWKDMTSAEAPILSQKMLGLPTAKLLAPDLNEVGVMAPTTALHSLLFQKCSVLMVTSANEKGHPIPQSLDQLGFQLGISLDFVLNHNRKIIRTVDDSVKREKILLRKSRGYTPSIFETREDSKIKTVLALGADLKNSFCIGNKHQIYEFPFAGNLHEVDTILTQRNVIQSTLELLKIKPDVILHDNHPQSVTLQLIPDNSHWSAGGNESMDSIKPTPNILPVPHHWAHAYAAQIESEYDLILAFDGTGVDESLELRGSDGFLMTEKTKILSLKSVPLIGGDSAIHSPWKSLVTQLAHSGISCDEISKIINPSELKQFYQLSLKMPGPPCSSMGRWFDAAAALIEFGTKNISYEAQGPIRLESFAQELIHQLDFVNHEDLPFQVVNSQSDEKIEIDGAALLSQLFYWKLHRRFSDAELAFLAHDQMARAVALAISCLPPEKMRKIAATGGVFQNQLFHQRLEFHLCQPLDRSTHFAMNDQSIALGQIFWFHKINEGMN